MNVSWSCSECGSVAAGETLPPSLSALPANELVDACPTASLRDRGLVAYRDPAVAAELIDAFVWIGAAASAKPSVFLPLGINLLVCCSQNSADPIPPSLPPHYRSVSCNSISSTNHLIHAFEYACSLIESSRLHPHLLSLADPLPPPLLLRTPTDELGRPLNDKKLRAAATVGEALKAVPRSKLAGKMESRVLLWSSDSSLCLAVAASYIIQRWRVTPDNALQFIRSRWPAAIRGVSRAHMSVLTDWSSSHGRGERLCAACIGGAGCETRLYGDPSPDVPAAPSATRLSTLTELRLSYTPLTLESVGSVARLLVSSSSLQRLFLFHTDLADGDAAQLLGALLISSPSFEDDDGHVTLAPHNTSLAVLDIGGNPRLGLLTAAALSRLVKRNESLSRLGLDATPSLCPHLQPFLANLAAQPSAVRHLSMQDNPLTQLEKSLAEVLPLLSSLAVSRAGLKGDIFNGSSRKSSGINAIEEFKYAGNCMPPTSSVLASFLTASPRLHSLDLADCSHVSIASLASSALSQSLQTLCLAHNDLHQQYKQLGNLLVQLAVLSELDVSSCRLGTAGAGAVMRALQPAARKVYLADNNVHDSCVTSLCSLLDRVPRLSFLDLSHNHLSDEVLPLVQTTMQVTSQSRPEQRLIELTIETAGNPGGANLFGLPGLCRSKRTVAYSAQCDQQNY